jgi:hypothetical protein
MNQDTNIKASELDKILNFLEEFSWLLDANKSINYKKISEVIKGLRYNNNASVNKPIQNEMVYNLIGILPTLLKDEVLFTSNSSLVQFAHEVLSLNISRWEKRSRNELIGLIICNVEEANSNRLEKLTHLSCELLKNKDKVKYFQIEAESKENIFSWNDTIQRIIGDINE